MAKPLVTLALEDGLATLTLSRPEAGNAIDWALADALGRHVAAIAADPSVRAILLAAEGKNFCVGGDIRAFAGDPDPAGSIGRLARRLHESIVLLAAHRAPLVVAVQGAAAGAGLGLAALGDVVLAGASAGFAMAYAGIGLTADGGATWLLPRLIGLRRAQELAFTGRRLGAAEAAEMGLVTRVVADDALTEEARRAARALASGPTAAFGAVKRLLADSARTTLAEQLAAEADSIEAAMGRADAAEGAAAFFARRAPVFDGR